MALLFSLTQKLSQGFSAFWSRWPRKVAKREAEKAWNQEVRPEDEEAIQKALDWQVPIFERRDPERIPHAATWIRGRRWDDEPPTPPKPTMTRNPATVTRHVTMAEQQLDARNRIHSLIATGMSPEDAKDQVYRAIGWIK